MHRHRVRIPLRGPWALLVGMICLGVATYQFLTNSALAQDGVATEALVVAVDSRLGRSSGGHRKRTYALTLEFEDQQGKQHRERTSYGQSYGGWRRGERVPIVYNPRDPSEFALDDWFDVWAMPLGFAVVGAIACGAFLVSPARAT